MAARGRRTHTGPRRRGPLFVCPANKRNARLFVLALTAKSRRSLMELSQQLDPTLGQPDFDRRNRRMCGEVLSRFLHGVAVVRALHCLSRPNFALTVEQVTVVVGHAHPPCYEPPTRL